MLCVVLDMWMGFSGDAYTEEGISVSTKPDMESRAVARESKDDDGENDLCDYDEEVEWWNRYNMISSGSRHI